MARPRSAPRSANALLTADPEQTPARVAHVSEVADREERQRLLSAILRDGRATGAEAVAAARLLEAMERTDTTSASQGLPPPTSRPEQVARMVRLISAAGPKITCEALEIYANRVESARRTAFANRAAGLNPMSIEEARKYRKRLLPREENHVPSNREDQRPEPGPSGAAAAESGGLRELHEAAQFAGAAAHEDERDGAGVGGPAPEDRGQ